MVVGAGVAAMPAIMYASNNGANVHVLEKGSHEGVHRLCIGGVDPKYIEPMTPEKIDVKTMTEDLYRCMGGVQCKMNVLSAYVKDSGAWVDWVAEHIADYGWMLLPLLPLSGIPDHRQMNEYDPWPGYDATFMFQDPEGQSMATGKSPNWMHLFYQMSCDYGATFHFNEPGYYLEREDGGRVTGVISVNAIDGTYRRYNAKMGVLLAAGDFQNDKQMVRKYAPHLERCVSSIAEPNNTGDMHKAGFYVDCFLETVNRYNYLCAKGVDEDCFKDPAWMTPIDTPPYYAAHWGVMITSTRCGLKTDERSQVIDTKGHVIPGLYAAGNNGGTSTG